MNTNINELKSLMKQFSSTIAGFSLPSWDTLPPIELYMDQVITLIEKYMMVVGGEKIITQSMINNYVKLGIMPAPLNKKYSKIHIAYLIIICLLKQTLSMSTIQKIIPNNLSEEEVEKTYNLFVKNQTKAFSYVTDSITRVAEPLLEEDSLSRVNDLIIQLGIASNICKIFTDRIVG